MKPFQVAPEAAREIDEAAMWYKSRQLGLGDDFITEFEDLLLQIRLRPSSFPRLLDVPRDLGVRRAAMMRFPYALLFQDLEDHIRIIAVAHLRRRPGYWLNRLSL